MLGRRVGRSPAAPQPERWAHRSQTIANHLGQVVIVFEYRRHLGPRSMHGAVRLSFDATQPYSFVSKAHWPLHDDYDAVVRRAVEDVLREWLGSLDRVQVVLESVEFHSVDSSVEGFRRSARAATEAAFSV